MLASFFEVTRRSTTMARKLHKVCTNHALARHLEARVLRTFFAWCKAQGIITRARPFTRSITSAMGHRLLDRRGESARIPYYDREGRPTGHYRIRRTAVFRS